MCPRGSMDIVLGRGKPSISMMNDDTSIAAAAAGHVLISFAIICYSSCDPDHISKANRGIDERRIQLTAHTYPYLPTPLQLPRGDNSLPLPSISHSSLASPFFAFFVVGCGVGCRTKKRSNRSVVNTIISITPP